MNNPLTPEQTRKLNEISQLPAEKQQKELQSFLKTLTPEQLAYLRQQQGDGECPFCMIIHGKIESYKVYEDEEVLAVLDIKPANEGHVLVMPKRHVQFSTELDDVGKLFTIANNFAKLISEAFQKDTNIFVANGAAAGQRVGHLTVHVIPREEKDGVEFRWEGKQVEKKRLEELQQLLRVEAKKPAVQELEIEDYEENISIP